MEAFGIGDIVRLKSGSLDMTVEGFEAQPATAVHPHAPDRLIRCVWMADGMIQSHVFAPHLLVGEKKTEPQAARQEDLGRTLTVKERIAPEPDPLYLPAANREESREVALV